MRAGRINRKPRSAHAATVRRAYVVGAWMKRNVPARVTAPLTNRLFNWTRAYQRSRTMPSRSLGEGTGGKKLAGRQPYQTGDADAPDFVDMHTDDKS